MQISLRNGLIGSFVLIITLVVGFLIGFFSAPNKTKEIENPINSYYSSLIESEDTTFNQKLVNNIDASKIESHLR